MMSFVVLVVVDIVVAVVLIVNTVVMALHVVTDHNLFSCGGQICSPSYMAIR